MGNGKKNGQAATVVRALPVKLTDEQIQKCGEKLAEMEIDLQSTRELAAAAATKYRERKKALAESIATVSQQINDGQEQRPATCELRPDYKRNTMEVVRTDSNEVVETRALTLDERQDELDLGIEEGPPLAPKAKSGRRKHDDGGNGVLEPEDHP